MSYVKLHLFGKCYPERMPCSVPFLSSSVGKTSLALILYSYSVCLLKYYCILNLDVDILRNKRVTDHIATIHNIFRRAFFSHRNFSKP